MDSQNLPKRKGLRLSKSIHWMFLVFISLIFPDYQINIRGLGHTLVYIRLAEESFKKYPCSTPTNSISIGLQEGPGISICVYVYTYRYMYVYVCVCLHIHQVIIMCSQHRRSLV